MKTNELMEECRKRFSSPKMDKIIDLHIEALDKAYDTGYNDACEKALEWLKLNLISVIDEPFHSISIVVIDFKTIEQALSNFKTKLYPYSIEQIDNCVKEE